MQDSLYMSQLDTPKCWRLCLSILWHLVAVTNSRKEGLQRGKQSRMMLFEIFWNGLETSKKQRYHQVSKSAQGFWPFPKSQEISGWLATANMPGGFVLVMAALQGKPAIANWKTTAYIYYNIRYHMYTYICTYIYFSIFVYVILCVYIYIIIYNYIYIHIHTSYQCLNRGSIHWNWSQFRINHE